MLHIYVWDPVWLCQLLWWTYLYVVRLNHNIFSHLLLVCQFDISIGLLRIVLSVLLPTLLGLSFIQCVDPCDAHDNDKDNGRNA